MVAVVSGSVWAVLWGAGGEPLGAPVGVDAGPTVHWVLVHGQGGLWELVGLLVISVLEDVAGSEGEKVGIGVGLIVSPPPSPGVAPGCWAVVPDPELRYDPLAPPADAPVEPVSLVLLVHVLVQLVSLLDQVLVLLPL